MVSSQKNHTLVYRIEVHARLLILKMNSHLQGLILVLFIDFKEIFPLHIYDLKNNSNISLKQLGFGINYYKNHSNSFNKTNDN